MYSSRHNRYLLVAIIALMCAVLPAFAGGIMSFHANGDKPVLADSLFVNTVIREQVAVTTVTQVFHNARTVAANPMYGVSMPANAMVTSMRWKIKDTWFKASMTASDTAVKGNQTTPGQNTFSKWFQGVPFIFTIKDTILPAEFVTVELTYVELLSYHNQMVSYTYAPMGFAGSSVSLIHLWTIDVQSGRTISETQTRPELPEVHEQTQTHVRRQGYNLSSPSNTYSVTFQPEFDALSMNVLSTKPANDDGYALMLAAPKTRDSDNDVMPNRVTFVIDRSGSMEGSRMVVAKDAALRCVQGLDVDDIFNVMHFDHSSTTWATEHKPATPENIISASDFISSIQPKGGTDILAALRRALVSHAADSYVNVIIFLTDGKAPIDHKLLRAANTSGTRIFVFGIGDGINPIELQRIGTEHNGSTILVEQESQVVSAVTTLFELVKDPIIKNPRISFSPDVVYDVYPSAIPDIYQGQQLMLVGRYKRPGDVTVTVEGTDRSGSAFYPFAASLTDDPNINIFVAKIWAKYRIEMLLEWMTKESTYSSRYKEWREEVIRLGKTYGIVTPFTSLVDNGTQDNGGGTTSVTHDEINVAKDRCSISPNPVRDQTTIKIDLRDMQSKHVRVEIVDINGALVKVLYDEDVLLELLELTWTSTDYVGTAVASGVYQLIVDIDGLRSATTINVVR